MAACLGKLHPQVIHQRRELETRRRPTNSSVKTNKINRLIIAHASNLPSIKKIYSIYKVNNIDVRNIIALIIILTNFTLTSLWAAFFLWCQKIDNGPRGINTGTGCAGYYSSLGVKATLEWP